MRISTGGIILGLALLLAACGGGASAPASTASGAPATPSDIARYQAADRQQVLEAGARREGNVTWYTALAGDAIDALTNGFEQKYPFVKVTVFRTDELELVSRSLEEAQANKQTFDVTDPNETSIQTFTENKILTDSYYSPSLANIADGLKVGASGATVHAASDWATIIGFGYNTTLLPDSAAPKTMADLLNPALSGKLGLAGTTTGYNWTGSVLHAMGDDKGKQFLQQFASQQKPAVQQISGKALMDLIAKGEVPASPTIYRDHVRQLQAQKAPVNWVALEPAVSLVNDVGFAAKAPHPNAGMLYVDYLLNEGQQVLKDHFYTTGAEKLPFQTWKPYDGRTTTQYDADVKAWSDLFKADFR